MNANQIIALTNLANAYEAAGIRDDFGLKLEIRLHEKGADLDSSKLIITATETLETLTA